MMTASPSSTSIASCHSLGELFELDDPLSAAHRLSRLADYHSQAGHPTKAKLKHQQAANAFNNIRKQQEDKRRQEEEMEAAMKQRLYQGMTQTVFSSSMTDKKMIRRTDNPNHSSQKDVELMLTLLAQQHEHQSGRDNKDKEYNNRQTETPIMAKIAISDTTNPSQQQQLQSRHSSRNNNLSPHSTSSHQLFLPSNHPTSASSSIYSSLPFHHPVQIDKRR